MCVCFVLFMQQLNLIWTHISIYMKLVFGPISHDHIFVHLYTVISMPFMFQCMQGSFDVWHTIIPGNTWVYNLQTGKVCVRHYVV